MTLREAVIKGGQLVLEAPLAMPDGTRVRVRVEPADDDPLLFLANNAVATGVTDMADQHNHHIYGAPRKPE